MNPAVIWMIGQDNASVSMAEAFYEQEVEVYQCGFHHSLPQISSLSLQREQMQQPDLITLPPFPLKERMKWGCLNLDDAFFHRHRDCLFVAFDSSPTLEKIKIKENLHLFLYGKEEPFRSVYDIALSEGILKLLLEDETRILKQRKIALLGNSALGILLYRLLPRLNASVMLFGSNSDTTECVVAVEEFNKTVETFDTFIVTDPLWQWNSELLRRLRYQSLLIQYETSCCKSVDHLLLPLGIRCVNLPYMPGVFAPDSCGEAAAETILRYYRRIQPKEEK